MTLTIRWSLTGLSRPERQAVESLTETLSKKFSHRLLSISLFGLTERSFVDEREIQLLVLLNVDDSEMEAQVTDEVLDLLLDTGIYLSVKCFTQRQYHAFEQMKLPFVDVVRADQISLWKAA